MAKNAKVPAKAQRNPLSRVMDHAKAFDMLTERTAGARIVEADRTKIKLSTLGDYIVGRLEGIREGGRGKDKSFRIYDFSFPGDNAGFLLGSGNLDQKLNGALAGHVLGILYESDVDTGEASPMRVFRVVDFGTLYPAGVTAENFYSVASTEDEADNAAPPAEAEAEDDDLPF